MRTLSGAIILAAAAASCTGEPARNAVPEPAAAITTQPHANLAQLMRGIPFTFSNIVFDAQSQDPGAPLPPADVTRGATAAYRSVYGGWQEVENSALALAESASLMMIPGRLCENGKPVPVDDEIYRDAAKQLVEAGQAAYKAAKTKNLDEMVAVSDTVATACASCHDPYRDVDDAKDRCTSRAPAQASR